MNKDTQSLRSDSVTFIAIGVGLFILSSLPFLSGTVSSYRSSIATRFDEQVGTLALFSTTVKEKIQSGADSFSTLGTLERYNRQLYAEQVAQAERIHELEQLCSATTSAQKKPQNVRTTKLSKFQGRWIILAGSVDGIEEGESVLAQGIYLGTVEKVSATVSTISVLEETQRPLVVMHQSTRELGLLQQARGKLIVQFTSRIESIKPDDTIVTVPDGKSMDSATAIAKVKSVLTNPSDSVSQVEVSAIAVPKVSLLVDVMMEKQ